MSPIAPAILPSLAQEHKERVWDTFRGDRSYYDLNHSAFLPKEIKDIFRTSVVLVRLLSGGDDTRLTEAIEKMSTLMDEANVRHYRKDVQGADHDYGLILQGLGDEAYMFWRDAFA